MQNQVQVHLLTGKTHGTTNIEIMVKGYILNCRAEGLSPKTITGYEMVLRNFIWYCRRRQFPNVQELDSTHIRHFLWYLASETCRWDSANPMARKQASSTTVNTYYRALRTFFNWMGRELFITENPFLNIKTPRKTKKVIQALPPSDVEKLFKVCSGKTLLAVRNKAILCIFLDAGLRISELANLSIDDYNLENASLFIRHGKGNKQRVVRIGSIAQKALWKYLAMHRKGNGAGLFLNKYGGTLTVYGIQTSIQRIGEKSGVKVHPHQLRHTFAISYLRAGGDVFSLQYLLGHSTLSMTQRYLQSLDANDAANAHKKFSPLDNVYKKSSSK